MKKITFVIPSRNNLEFLKLSYRSIRNLVNTHDILILDDYSIDGTREWLESLNDDNLITYYNPGPDRIGIVGMFDKGIEMARTEIIFAFHADMIAGPNLDVNILKHLKQGTVVCATRIEPPLHPPGPEKITQNWGNEANDINIDSIISSIAIFEDKHKDKTTEGIFAPWCMYKSDYLAVGGHDELFAPQSKEDSDLFNRFVLAGYNVIQSWDGLVYHFTSRGSRFNKYAGGDTGKNSNEWIYTTTRNGKEFIRKWGHFVKHDELMKPIIPHKRNIAFVVKNCNLPLLEALEPWCDRIYVDEVFSIGRAHDYIEQEQSNTKFDLRKRVLYIGNNYPEGENDVVVVFDANRVTEQTFYMIQNISDIVTDTNDVGEFEVDCLTIIINSLETYEHNLIKIKK
jgi:glycosyltransferase involved in cell wall biosynthesis